MTYLFEDLFKYLKVKGQFKVIMFNGDRFALHTVDDFRKNLGQ